MEEWVFHGTYKDSILNIIEEGFKIGGKDNGVIARHGSSMGQGVYTAEGPMVPMNLLLQNTKRYDVL